METQTGNNYNSAQSECDRLKNDLQRNKGMLDGLKKQRDDLISDSQTNNYRMNLEELGILTEAIKGYQDEISKLESLSQTLGCNKNNKPQISFDNQSIISTSSVRRKDAKALEISKLPQGK